MVTIKRRSVSRTLSFPGIGKTLCFFSMVKDYSTAKI